MTRPPDRVEMLGGITHLPAEFREVARLANLAGLDGYEVADVKIGLDLEAAVAALLSQNDDSREALRTYITISYHPPSPFGTRAEEIEVIREKENH